MTEDGIEAIHDRLFINEYMEEDIHKYAELIRSGEHTATLHTSMNSQLEQSPRYINILQPAGFGDELRAVLVSGDACWGYLTLYRKTESAVFTEEERMMIQSWTASIASMLQSTSLTLIDEITSESPEEPGILITSDTFQLLSLNASAQYWLSQLRMLEHVGPDVLPRPVRAVSSHLQRKNRGRTGRGYSDCNRSTLQSLYPTSGWPLPPTSCQSHATAYGTGSDCYPFGAGDATGFAALARRKPRIIQSRAGTARICAAQLFFQRDCCRDAYFCIHGSGSFKIHFRQKPRYPHVASSSGISFPVSSCRMNLRYKS
ncbi:hypothetical protein Q0F98_33735 [Paenibacillus amylolyticus]|nr:hypothetical protein Q0F98_33735 [Paenibacillus amylolyticus]